MGLTTLRAWDKSRLNAGSIPVAAEKTRSTGEISPSASVGVAVKANTRS